MGLLVVELLVTRGGITDGCAHGFSAQLLVVIVEVPDDGLKVSVTLTPVEPRPLLLVSDITELEMISHWSDWIGGQQGTR